MGIKDLTGFLTAVVFSCSTLTTTAQQRPVYPAATLDMGFIDTQLKDAVSQAKVLAVLLPENALPRTFQADSLVNSGSGWWTSGFYPGLLWYLYGYSGDPVLLRLAQERTALLEKERYNTGTHDLGFMLYCSFGNALRITRDTAAYKNILVTGARSLAGRYNPSVGAIRSWNMPSYPVIIDNMMNLEFLLAASKLSGDTGLRNVAIAHANTTMQHHFRPDHSCYHLVDYNPKTGHVMARKTVQGAYDESAWARGQAWALYGYTVMYRETKDRKYLDLAKKIAGFIRNHPNMPADKIPYWDFNAPDLSEDHPFARYKQNRDASAAAIMASAFIELSGYVAGKERAACLSTAGTMLYNLAQPPYKAAPGTNGGFLLQHSMGSLPRNVEVDVPLSYADYYYVEALLRYKQLIQVPD